MKAVFIAILIPLSLVHTAYAITAEQRAYNASRRGQQRLAQERAHLMQKHDSKPKHPTTYR
jgi:hypothetical protein